MQLTNVWNLKLHQVWKPCIAHTVSQEGFHFFQPVAMLLLFVYFLVTSVKFS